MTNTVAGTPGLDPTLPDVQIVIGGKKRQLCFDFNAIALVHKLTGINLLRDSVEEPNPQSVRAMLWSSLLRENPDLTLEEVGTWLNMWNLRGVYDALLLAWFGSNATAKGDEVPGEEQAQATTA